MLTQIIVTAFLSSAMTLLVAALFYSFILQPRLQKQLQEVAEEIETRVKSGVEAAGEDMLPAFREQVREGFLEALAQWPSNEFRQVTRTGAEIVEDGLNTLFGRRPKG